MRITKKRIPRVGVILSALILAVVLIWLLVPNLFVPDDVAQDRRNGSLAPFTEGHFLGTDKLGRDVLDLIIAGTRSAMVGPICIAIGSIIIGLFLGGLAGWYGGPLDWIISRYADLTLSMPSLLLAIVAAGVIGGGYWVSVLVMIILYSPFDIRLVRAAVIQQKGKPYIESALILRMSTLRILMRHIFPNIALIVFVNFFLNIAYGLVSMSSLSYLGLGVSPGDADWGRLLSDGKALLYDNPGAIVGSGLAIVLTAVAINVIGSYVTERNLLEAQ
ncbi:MAG: ABC transporter permease [Clostridiales Family XIII bacterium]|jgi:peptide/nickel transport system permease protein|nr:ABC transporter permease [Clostridiales Family XIII bacterium]